ncbi:MAG: hypothetical protein AUG09_06505 [Acidobacteria bacterium 13_1_20CM_2_68_7]|nr:MAG: hypothetical protein AUG09_06505 [Acidobacteria bacterium 13_1_20CM_2_68_7]
MNTKRFNYLRVGLPMTAMMILAQPSLGATPSGGSLSPASPTLTWTGGAFLVPTSVSCNGIAAATCDSFTLTILPPKQAFVVTVRIAGRRSGDDIDLFVRDPNGDTIAMSGTPGGSEEVVLNNPAAGTYTVTVQPFLVVPSNGPSYDGFAAIGSPSHDEISNAYNGAVFTADFRGAPSSTPAPSSPLVSQLKVSFNYVGRQAAEPTIGVNQYNSAFFAASTFDSPVGVPGIARLARTLVLRSRDKGVTWQSVSPPLLLGQTTATDPDFSLDPYLHVDPVTGRLYSFDLNVVCSEGIFSDDEGVTWQHSLPCSNPVNDHLTVISAAPGRGPAATPAGPYPRMLYYCFNRVVDSSCERSNDGGLTYTPTTPAFTGSDPDAGSLCGGLTGQLAADATGRIFLPKGHCGLPWVAVSEDGGSTWTRVRIAGNTPMADHEVSLAVDTADNVYAVWADGPFRLPFISVSTDHGLNWSTPIMMAPPGVHEVNFPTIAAGDAGRIAILFPGTESQDRTDATRPWNIYIVVSVDALSANPVFTWTIANDKSDPVHRGSCGPDRCDAEDGGSMFDFLDIQVSPVDGVFWGTASDTCVTDPDPARNCVTNPGAQKLRPGQGVAIRQLKGPSLFAKR